MKSANLIVLLIIPIVLTSSGIAEKMTARPAGEPAITVAEDKDPFKKYADDILTRAGLKESRLRPEVFYKALQGFLNIKKQELARKEILAVIDFGLPSTEKRLWIVDIKNKMLLENTFVAHGKNSGNNRAVRFSNIANTNMSSLGFYITDETYYGKHGLSLRLRGIDETYNSNAYSRAIVMHGAEYVCEDFIRKHGRLGRSWGCPAVPREKEKVIIETLKEGAVLFIHHPSVPYTSKFLKQVPDIN